METQRRTGNRTKFVEGSVAVEGKKLKAFVHDHYSIRCLVKTKRGSMDAMLHFDDCLVVSHSGVYLSLTRLVFMFP